MMSVPLLLKLMTFALLKPESLITGLLTGELLVMVP